MPVASTRSVALNGIDGHLVEVEADVSQTLPGFVIIGLPDAALGEARERVRLAASNSGCALTDRKLTVNLSPASLPKHGSSFDLAIALACLAAAGSISATSVRRVVHVGELRLDGRLRPSAGVLPAALSARRAGADTVMVPAGNVAEASLVSGLEVVGVHTLREAAIWHGGEFARLVQLDHDGSNPISDADGFGESSADASVVVAPGEPGLRVGPGGDGAVQSAPDGDLSDVVGNPDAVESLIVAAAGGHNLSLLGPPGSGKTMLAARLSGLLPDLDEEASLEASCIRSLAGHPLNGGLVTRPPIESPHHTASAAAMIGGGSTIIRPGAAARAAHGILFLDEAPEFAPAVLDSLRQPLESGTITIHRARVTASFPGRFQLVLAANPCPCGNYGVRDSECTCPPTLRRRYLGRISGPLNDRIDIHLAVNRITANQLRVADEIPRISTADGRARVEAARERARARLKTTPWRTNSQVPGTWLRHPDNRLPYPTVRSLDLALERGLITMRGFDRVLRLSWTLADLGLEPQPTKEHVGQALYLRRGVSS
ncbi:YifB family Mg chelatase-like AAA ATPase [Lysinibacter cavernae]|uniref:Magnesium chelatase family protein n=1 Tax=Lysinibacter cavernae TaxID=1640652 RepID=A0A7X5TS29_9MICO|nr:ATP-binding protein [Lysinibacter cavernae]NIH52420.1 magnesium chelatase family protein [Lysinibacter cavernae]